MKLSERLLNLRMDEPFTLRELSLKTGLSISFLSDLEHGRSDPSFSTLVTLSRAYGIRLVDLLRGVDVGDEAAEVLPHDDRDYPEPDHGVYYGDGRDFDEPYPPEDDPSYLT